jgi:predicted adenylyl cyclase CyaB
MQDSELTAWPSFCTMLWTMCTPERVMGGYPLVHRTYRMSYEEVEVKLLIDDLSAVRQRLLAIGAALTTPRCYEDNLCFDTPDAQLQQQGRLLRLRRDRCNLLTYKEPPPAAEADFKVRHEYEIEVSDFTQAQALLEKLGFVLCFRYEKYRETFHYQETEIVLDETPVGVLMEIEGARAMIDTLVTRLGLDASARLTMSYGEIFHAVRSTYQLPFSDMTFANFQGWSIDLHTCHLT